MMKRALVLAVAASITAAVGSPQPAADAPNIVLVLADDLGYGDLASYGHPLIRTPRLDRLAHEGVRFTSYYAGAAACTPARAALLTGRYGVRAGLGNVVGPDSPLGLPSSEITLAEGLRTRGYRTMAVGKWHLGSASAEHLPLAHGFDRWFGLPYSNDMMPPWVKTNRPLRMYRDAQPIDGEVDQANMTVKYTEEAVQFVRESKGKPFFLYLAHNMPHLPIHAADRFRGKSRAGVYGDVIEMLDWSTGEVLDALEREGVAKRTIVVFTSDNGPWNDLPPRMLHGGVEPWHTGSAGLLRGSKATTYEGGSRVPAIIRWPGRVAPDRVSPQIATAMDLYVTLTEAAGASVPADRPIDGDSLVPMLEGKPSVRERPYFYFSGPQLEAVRQGNWKLRMTKDAGVELFDLENDPSERYNRASARPEIVKRLESMLREFEKQLPGR